MADIHTIWNSLILTIPDENNPVDTTSNENLYNLQPPDSDTLSNQSIEKINMIQRHLDTIQGNIESEDHRYPLSDKEEIEAYIFDIRERLANLRSQITAYRRRQ